MSVSQTGVPSKKAALRGIISIPGDKSITHRSIILSALAEGKSRIVGYLPSEDCQRTIDAFRAMGISFRSEVDKGVPVLEVEGQGLRGLIEPEEVIDCGNSGTTMRLMTGLLSGQSFFSILTGDGSLRNRPMRRVVDPLRLMGGEIHGRSEGSLAPLAISGKVLHPIEYTLPIPSAQVKSAILLAGLTLSGRTTIYEPGPSRDHTERMLRYFGVQFEKKKNRLSIEGGISFKGRTIEVPGDISSAAFFLVAATIMPGSEVVLRKVGINPTRSGILNVLQGMGADITVESLSPVSNEPLADIVVRSSTLKGFVIEGDLATSILDEFPILCIAAAKAEGKTVIRGAKELRFKESDRIERMAAGLRGMGVKVETFPDGIEIEGIPDWKGTVCTTQGDHRIAMAMSVAGLIAEGGNNIDDTECIKTSFPGFFDLMSGLLRASFLKEMKDLNPERRLVIAIDGPAASGKSTAARALALRLGYLYLDTGALYRAIAWKLIEEKINPEDVSGIECLCLRLEIQLSPGEELNEVWVDGVNTNPYLRLPEVSALSSTIAQLPCVRDKLLSVQQAYGRLGGLVAEGRDIGTVIFPDADLKFYLDADLSARGTRRYKDLSGEGHAVGLSETTKDLSTRDQKDRARPISPLRQGSDAIVIDSTRLSASEVLEKMLEEVERVSGSL